MRISKLIRVGLVLGVLLLVLLSFSALLYLMQTTLSVWERLQSMPDWALYLFVVPSVLVLALGLWLIWRIFRPARGSRPVDTAASDDEQGALYRLAKAAARGLDVSEASEELERLAERKSGGRLHVAMFGEISTGKSSIIKAILPDARVEVGATGGSTRQIEHHHWQTVAGDEVILTDLPGLAEAGGTLDELAREEARRAHIVIYVCDGDLTRSQYREIQKLLDLGKPLIVAINKKDTLLEQDLAVIEARIAERVGDRVEVVAVSAGGSEEVVRERSDGREELAVRPRPADTSALVAAMQGVVEDDPQLLEELRDAAVFSLVSEKLDRIEASHRLERGQHIVKAYTRRAVVGALAAVSPGTDVLIQGYLGTRLVKELCALYNAPTRELDIERFLDLSQSHVGRALPILLAIAGNAFKAFPGVGTVTGGLIHAVAYGLIFDALGRSLVQTLEIGGQLRPVPAAARFKETLSDDLQTRTRALAQLALEAKDDAPRR